MTNENQNCKMKSENEEEFGMSQEDFIEQNTARLNVMQAKEKIGDVKKNFDSLKTEEKELEILKNGLFLVEVNYI